MTTLRVGIVAGESTTDRQLESYTRNDRTRLTAVCDRDEERALRRSLDLEANAYYRDVESMLDGEALDGVDIRTPQSRRADQVLRALEADLNVRVEAPVARDLEDARTIARAARRSRGTLQVDEPILFHRPLLDARELVDAGEIGRLSDLSVEVAFCDSTDPVWDVSKLEPQDWRFRDDRQGASPMLASTGHQVLAMALFLVGSLEKLQVWRSSTSIGSGLSLDTPTRATWKHFRRDCYGTLSLQYAPYRQLETECAPLALDVTVTGSEGQLTFSRTPAPTGGATSVALVREGQTIHYDRENDPFDESLARATENFVEASLGARTPLLGPGEAQQVSVLSRAFGESADRGRAVTLQHD